VGRLDAFLAVAAEIALRKVVGEDEDDVGRVRNGLAGGHGARKRDGEKDASDTLHGR
jgi:hypothetical protein